MIIVNVFNLIIMDCQYYVVWGEGMNDNKRLTLFRHSKIYILISSYHEIGNILTLEQEIMSNH